MIGQGFILLFSACNLFDDRIDLFLSFSAPRTYTETLSRSLGRVRENYKSGNKPDSFVSVSQYE